MKTMTKRMMYKDGKGVPQNYWEAYIWFSLATTDRQETFGIDIAKVYRDENARKLSPADLVSAQKEAARRHAEFQRKSANEGDAQ